MEERWLAGAVVRDSRALLGSRWFDLFEGLRLWKRRGVVSEGSSLLLQRVAMSGVAE